MDWINDLKDHNGASIIAFPSDDGIGTASVSGNDHQIRARSVVAPDSTTSLIVQAVAQQIFVAPSVTERTLFLPALLKPSKILPAGAAPETTGSTAPVVYDIGARIPITGLAEMNVIGECIHRFLAADDVDVDLNVRHTRADRLRDLWSVFQISAESMVETSDRLSKFVNDIFGIDCIWHKECPLTGRIGHQRIHGVIDLLLETQEAFFILDHKSFPGRSDQWIEKAYSFKEQLIAYQSVISQASNKPVKGLFVHMPLVGKVIQL